MIIQKASSWGDYSLLDSGNRERLEKFGPYTLIRPDPQTLWLPLLSSDEWKKSDAMFEEKRGWRTYTSLPVKWRMTYKNISMWVKLSPFKHTGVFPEQSAQWDFIEEKIKNANRPINMLNLFGYTGIASLVAAAAGAKVTHVDGSKPTIGWARENQDVSKLTDKPIRWILDDANKFVEREIKREVKYDAILMDPPIYGHGPDGEKWDFMYDFPRLLNNCKKILTDNPLFVIVNAYAISASALMLENVLKDVMHSYGGTIESGELVLKEEKNERLLSTGIFGRWIR